MSFAIVCLKKVKCDMNFVKSCAARWTSQKTKFISMWTFLVSNCYFLLIFTFENSKSKQSEFWTWSLWCKKYYILKSYHKNECFCSSVGTYKKIYLQM